MKKYSSNKDIHKLVCRLIRDKWRFKHLKKHGSVCSPKGKQLTVPSSPSDRRAYMNFYKDIQRLS
ncbi:hypothetical protein TW85_19175 [Marinomonas sp. S3726]|nr:hypothetical protein TW85_19175 [Marinomonas sp. S3726]